MSVRAVERRSGHPALHPCVRELRRMGQPDGAGQADGVRTSKPGTSLW